MPRGPFLIRDLLQDAVFDQKREALAQNTARDLQAFLEILEAAAHAGTRHAE